MCGYLCHCSSYYHWGTDGVTCSGVPNGGVVCIDDDIGVDGSITWYDGEMWVPFELVTGEGNTKRLLLHW